MSLRRELDQHRKSLAEIREIMNSMKTLAYMETRKLSRFIDAQQAVVGGIETAINDLLSHYPEVWSAVPVSTSAYLLVGSERGFCGDFNHALLDQLEHTLAEQQVAEPILVTIGRKLDSLLDSDPRVAIALEGASTGDEVTALLGHLVAELTELERQHPALNVYALYHRGDGEVTVKKMLPPFPDVVPPSPMAATGYAYPPDANLSPAALFAELSDHYLFALLHQLLYTSLYAENHLRVTHMEGAVQHLDEESGHLAQRYNALRQEEITEEIEVILLNAANLEGCCPDTAGIRKR